MGNHTGNVYENLKNQKFGKLTAIEYFPGYYDEEQQKQFYGKWRCRCECGTELLVKPAKLKAGKVYACNTCQPRRTPSPIKDLTGLTFGKWTVQYMFDKETPAQRIRMCYCRCECGNEGAVTYHNLLKGQSTGCQKCGWEGMKSHKVNELSGMKVGELQVLEWDTSNNKWKCLCSCGNTCLKSTSYLRNNIKLPICCGIKANHPDLYVNYHPKIKDLVGNIFGELTVVEQLPDRIGKDGRTYDRWLCKCSCGNTREVVGEQLRNGKITVCSISNHNNNLTQIDLDILGNIYGDLTVISQAPDKIYANGRHSDKWMCKCSCGETIEVLGEQLRNGKVKVCSVQKHKQIDKEKELQTLKQKFIGRKNKMNNGEVATVIEVLDHIHILIQYESGVQKYTTIYCFMSGRSGFKGRGDI